MPVNIFVHRTNLMGGAPGESTGRIYGWSPRMGTQFGGTPFAAKAVNFYQLNLSCSINFYHVLCLSLFFGLQFLGLVVLNLKVLRKPVSPGAGFPVDLQQGRRISFLPGFQAPRCGRFWVTVMVWTWRVVAVSQEPSCRISAKNNKL